MSAGGLACRRRGLLCEATSCISWVGGGGRKGQLPCHHALACSVRQRAAGEGVEGGGLREVRQPVPPVPTPTHRRVQARVLAFQPCS